MEPAWLRFLNLANGLVCIEATDAVSHYVYIRTGVRNMGPYIWMDYNEAIQLSQWFTGIRPPIILVDRPDEVIPMIPTSINGKIPLDCRPSCLQTPKGVPQVKRLRSLYAAIAHTTPGISVPTWYARAHHIPAWKFRTGSRRLKSRDLALTTLGRIHYYIYFVVDWDPGGPQSISCKLRRCLWDGTSHLMQASVSNAYGHQPAVRLEKRLKFLFTIGHTLPGNVHGR